MNNLTQNEINNIEINVYAYNELNRYKNIIKKDIFKLLEKYKNKQVLKVNGELKKDIQTDINNYLKQVEKENQTTLFKNGTFARIDLYTTNSEYNITIKLRLCFNTKRELSRFNKNEYDTIYKENYMYLVDLNFLDKNASSFNTPINTKVLSGFINENLIYETYKLKKELREFSKAKELKEKFEKQKEKISLYDIKKQL